MASDNGRFVAGHYSATYGGSSTSNDLGTTEQGFNIRPVFHSEQIRVDDYGDAVVDGIYRGYNIRVQCQLSEWVAGGRQLVQFPYDTTLGTLANIGQSWVGGGFAKQLVCTPTANINTANKTFTFPLAIGDGDHGGWNLNNKLRRVDLSMLILVNRSTGVLFTESA